MFLNFNFFKILSDSGSPPIVITTKRLTKNPQPPKPSMCARTSGRRSNVRVNALLAKRVPDDKGDDVYVTGVTGAVHGKGYETDAIEHQWPEMNVEIR